MNKKKVFVFLPDGGGLRNFAFSSFKQIGEEMNFQVVYWNKSLFPINKTLGFEEVVLNDCAPHPLTSIYVRARKHIELNLSQKKFNDPVYPTYKFPFNYKGIKNIVKSLFTMFLIQWYASQSGLKRLRNKIDALERKHSNYHVSKRQLEIHKPDMVFCSNQRNTQAIGALLAAKDLGIKTMCFIQSWDNVPKAMQVVETDYYCVWSDLMKTELLKYYPFINEAQVFVTGTPQFEMHYNTALLQSREVFFEKYDLDINKKYICFSGDDETTSPLDQYYLEDLANAVRRLNKKGENLGIIFRRCPFDFSKRYDEVIAANSEIIKPLNPIWIQSGKQIVEILPQPDDFEMLYNVCEHTELVANVCSSTVFDFVAHKKPCIYFNYEQPQLRKGIRDIGQNYNYVHFRSMPSKDAVVFCLDKHNLDAILLGILNGDVSNVNTCLKWYEVVVGLTPTKSSAHIWGAIKRVLD